ncbi:hypothetical protein L596_023070 [Steinernema carpocapsae]|nr:hypothetical protein L596_023070 [Steinernema carpocapsae]
MTQKCPRTCGRCPNNGGNGGGIGNGGQNCMDINNDCGPKAYMCNNERYFTFMTQQCPRTCGRCPRNGGNGVGIRNGARPFGNGNNGVGIGNGARPNNQQNVARNCVDTHKDCALFVRKGFCEKAFYTLEHRRQMCGFSCRLC